MIETLDLVFVLLQRVYDEDVTQQTAAPEKQNEPAVSYRYYGYSSVLCQDI